MPNQTSEAPAGASSDAIPERLSTLLEGLNCTLCGQPLPQFEFSIIWPDGRFSGHLDCWLRDGKILPRRGGTS